MARYISKLTKEQKAQINSYRDKWIEIGLKTGKTDWDTFDKYMPICYKKAGIDYPKNIVRVKSPLVGGLAASISEAVLRKNSSAVRGAVDGAVGDAVDDAVRVAVRVAVRDAVDGAVGGAVRGAVDGAVRDAVDGAVDGAVGDAVDDAVRVAVRGAVGDAVRGAVRVTVGGAVDDAVRVAVRDAVDGAVGGAVDELYLKWHYWLGGQFWVGGWYWGVAFANFFFDVCKLKLSKDIMERAFAYRKVCESVNYIWPNRNFVIVCARPAHIDRDESGRLHSSKRKAIMYPDGWGLYMLFGVRFDEKLWKKVTSPKVSLKTIFSIENMEQRMAALKLVGAEKLLKSKNAKKVGKSKRGNELYEIQDVFDTTAYYLKYTCPSTGRVYVSGVDPEIGEGGNPDACMAWKFGLSLDEYKSLEIEA